MARPPPAGVSTRVDGSALLGLLCLGDQLLYLLAAFLADRFGVFARRAGAAYPASSTQMAYPMLHC